jgi:hypothetical protein
MSDHVDMDVNIPTSNQHQKKLKCSRPLLPMIYVVDILKKKITSFLTFVDLFYVHGCLSLLIPPGRQNFLKLFWEIMVLYFHL